MRFPVFSLAALVTIAALGTAAPAPQLAPILQPVADIVANKFIVVMKNGLSDSSFLSYVSSLGANLGPDSDLKMYDIGDFKAFSGAFSQSLLNTLASGLNVAYIEPVTIVRASALTSQSNAPWGLARISHRNLGSTDYIYDDSAGAGTFAYVLDTGIYTDHTEFQGRASFGANFAGDGNNADGNGHGTHCAGTIGSRAYGVAKRANLIAVKVLDAQGQGPSSGVISGIDWAVRDARSKGRIGKAVGSLSLGGVFSRATNDAVAAAVDAGLFMAVAAGNSASPARLSSPASEPKACTVGATDKTDAIASYSNYGSIVDILAPGSEILSTWIRSPTDTNTISGTSMAAPHVAGLAAYFLALNSGQDPRTLCQRLVTESSKGKLRLGLGPLIAGTPNALAYNGNGA